MTVQIVTDSASDLSPALASQYGIHVAPLHVQFGDETFADGRTISPELFYQKMRASKELPKTSQPTPHDMMTAYREALQAGPVIGIHVSSKLSGTYQTAVMTAGMVHQSIEVFDSLSGSGGLAKMAVTAAQMAQAGATVQEILAGLEQMRATTQVLVGLNTLENAVKGGRVSPLAGFAATLLGVKPIVHVKDGLVIPFDKVRGRGRMIDRLVEVAAERCQDWSGRLVWVNHGLAEAEAQALAERIRQEFRPKEVFVGPIGAAIGTYAAEGAMALSF
ncbi:MAG TPA: DegV family protein [Symbiobacteriaceae bacterium]|nr:DegV family protein [Symbiobacteriaceae bacterium]